jgi:hypothetical protein
MKAGSSQRPILISNLRQFAPYMVLFWCQNSAGLVAWTPGFHSDQKAAADALNDPPLECGYLTG